MLSEYKLFPMNGLYFNENTFLKWESMRFKAVGVLLCACICPICLLWSQTSLPDSAWALLGRGDNLGAQRFVEKMLSQKRTISIQEKADLLNAKGVALRRNDDPHRAITVHYLALKLREKAFGNQSLPVARSWQNIANCWIDLANSSKADQALQKALYALKDQDDLDLKVKILQGLGGLHQGQKQWALAIEYHLQALKALESRYSPQDPILQNTLTNLAQCYLDGRKISAATFFINRLQKLNKAPTANLFALRLMANATQQSGDLERATQLLRKALIGWDTQAYPDQGEWLHLLSDLSNVLEQKGELDEADLLFSQILYNLEKKPDLKMFRASVHNNYANLLWRWGRDSMAILHYDQALGLFPATQTQELNAVYLNLASIYLQAGDPVFAQVYLNLINTAGASLETQVVTQLIQGQVYEKQTIHQLSKGVYVKAYALLSPQQQHYPELFVNVSIRLAKAFEREQDFESGISLLKKGLQALGQKATLQADLRPSETSELLNALAALTLSCARATASPHNWSQAWYAHRRAIGFMQLHQQLLVGKYSLLLAGSNARETFEGMLEVCYERSKRDPGFRKEAFIYADMSKALLLRRLMQEARAKSFAGVAAADLDRELAIQTDIARLSTSLQDANVGIQRSRLEAELAELESQKQRLIWNLEKKYPAYHQLKYASPRLNLSALQKGLKKNQSVLAYFLAKKYVYIFVLDRKHLYLKRLRLQPQFFNILDSCYTLLISPPSIEDTANLHTLCIQSHLLYKTLIRPIEVHLRKKVTVIPDAQLHYLPFDALLYAEANHLGPIRNFPFLLKQHAIHYVSSATLLNRREVASSSNRSFCLAVAPRFNAQVQGLNPLPNAEEEIERITKDFAHKKLLNGEKADELAFTKLAPQANIIHLATHGIVDNKQPDLSYLAFADHRQDNTIDGRLTASEVYGLRLKADLVFLSACQTGVGQWYASEGMLSLSRAFYYAGAKSLVATLWSIPDNQTAQVAEHFYAELHQNLPKDLALQKAKLKYLRGAHSIRAHPAYWAAFTLSGDLSPLPRPGLLQGWPIWLLGLLLLALGAWWYRHKLPRLRDRNA